MPTSPHYRILPFVLAAAAVILSSGCAGHNSSGALETELEGDLNATNAVNTYLNALHVGRASLAAAALTYLQKDPAFVTSGMSADGTVWGELRDGVLYSVDTNDPTFDSQGGASTPALDRLASPTKMKRAVAAGEIPSGPQAYVFNAFPATCLSPAVAIATELTAAGYQVTQGTGTLSEWKSVNDAAVLFNSGHGARIDINGTSTFYQQSGQTPLKSDATWAIPLLKQHVLMIDGIAVPTQNLTYTGAGSSTMENRYTFRADYLTNHSMFTANSFFWDECCSGTSSPGRNFASSLQTNNGLSVFAGWSQPVVILDANESSSFFFDRALGLNQFAPVDPTNPPPNDWNSIWAIMKSTNRAAVSSEPLSQSDPASYPGHTNEPVAVLAFVSGSGSLTTLIPSIDSVSKDTANKILTLTGSFGAGRGTVNVDGTALTIKSWATGSITTDLPSEAGKVQVVSPFKTLSNKVPLSGGTYTLSGPGGGNISVDDELTVNLNGKTIYSDSPGTLAGDRSPITFTASPGDKVEIIVWDWYGFYSGLSEVDVTTPAGVTSTLTSGFSLQTPPGNQALEFDQTFTLP